MPPYELLLPFFVATAVFACIPGPGMLYAAAQTLARGRRAGWLSVFGFHVAGYAHIAAAAFGLALVLQTVPVLYAVVKFAGAAYLIWLGVKLFAARAIRAAPAVHTEAKSHQRAIWESITVEALNPKTALFYLAFLPQFTDPAAMLPLWAQTLILGTIANCMFSLTDVACVVLAAKMTNVLTASPRAAHRIGGGILIGLGVNLAASKQ